MPKYQMIVMSNAVPGREDEYNKWYTEVHVPDVLKVPGVVAAQRYRLADSQRSSKPSQWKYAAVYEIDTPSLQEVQAEIGRRSRTPAMVVSDAIADTWAYVFEPITEKVSAKR
jgi:hypothetical protein